MPRLVVDGNRLYERMEHMKAGRILEPLDKCFAFELGEVEPLLCDWFMIDRVNDRLQRECDRDLKIYYDVATAGDSSRPGWHLYRRFNRGGVESHDSLELVFSVQRDTRLPWPQGRPCAVGEWVIEEWKRRWKAHETGTDISRIKASYEAKQTQFEKKVDEASSHFAKEADKAIRGTTGDKLYRKMKKDAQSSRPTKTTVALSAGGSTIVEATAKP